MTGSREQCLPSRIFQHHTPNQGKPGSVTEEIKYSVRGLAADCHRLAAGPAGSDAAAVAEGKVRSSCWCRTVSSQEERQSLPLTSW